MEKETKILIGIIAAIVIGFIGVFMVFNKQGSSTTADSGKLVRADSQTQGTGSVQLVEFGDYQCPSCGAAFPVTQKIMQDFEGKVTFVFRNFPLETIHKNAMVAAKYAQASSKQDKFWEMHDMLYTKQAEWSDLGDPTGKFAEYAKALGMNADQLKKDVNESSVADYIQRDMDDGNSLGVTGTPTFYVNGKQIAKNDYDSIKSAIEAAQK